MKIINYTIIFLLFFLISGTAKSQDAVKVLDRVYGPDQTLCNGKKYSYAPPPGTIGHQYLSSMGYFTGTLSIGEKSYEDVSLNYDLFNQQLLLLYNDEAGDMTILEVSKAWIKDFRVGTMYFEYLSLEKQPRYYQVLGDGAFRILYYWRKDLNLESRGGTPYFTFTPAERDSFVLMDGQLKPFTTNRSFIKLFDPSRQAGIKSYLHKNKIRVKKASDRAMTDMVTFINSTK
jgi:hypothetical protein